jgi:hypothetical protein
MWKKHGKEAIKRVIDIPVPTTFAAIVWVGIGITFGRAFGKQLDQTIQNTERFKQLGTFTQYLIERFLDAMHHWWMGALLMLWFVDPEFIQVFGYDISIYWFGMGLLIDDIPDMPPRIKKLLSYWFKENTE